ASFAENYTTFGTKAETTKLLAKYAKTENIKVTQAEIVQLEGEISTGNLAKLRGKQGELRTALSNNPFDKECEYALNEINKEIFDFNKKNKRLATLEEELKKLEKELAKLEKKDNPSKAK
ncbi:MAG TPA: hypothetical protein VMW66_05165, partial [Elusimicrobiales bacterium]|nr:hypothetical protein [Elusimicrobiales bacterium]